MNGTLPDGLCWWDARSSTVKRQFGELMYPITAKNDELLIVQAFSAAPQEGAILGIELKKKVTAQVTCYSHFTAINH
jgi:hypothetical protein